MISPRIDLAARWLGASVLAASDESFGLKENLLVETPAAFEPGHYDHRGEIVDGWETRRRREAGHDWVIVRLGVPGVIDEIDVDTSFFTGNFPAAARIEALQADGYPSVTQLTAARWTEIVAETALTGDAHNRLPVTDRGRYTHLRLSALPDGGIARLRVWGSVVADPRLWRDLTVEVSAVEHGGRILSSSDDFYTSASTLIRPDTPRTMGEGWETRRRRGEGFDSVVIELAATSDLQLIRIDTAHFKYNASGSVRLYGAEALPNDPAANPISGSNWVELLERTSLQPDTRHDFTPVAARRPVRIVRLDAFPDGGIARVRLFGTPTVEALAAAERHWLAGTD